MPKSALITLTTAGINTGPFNLLSNIDGYTTPFETEISKAALVAGYVSNLVPDSTTAVRVQSINSVCTNYVDLLYAGITTTTTTLAP